MSTISPADRAHPALLRMFSRWLRGRVTAASLQTLDDAQLKDIGLSRSDIESVALYGRHDATRQVR